MLSQWLTLEASPPLFPQQRIKQLRTFMFEPVSCKFIWVLFQCLRGIAIHTLFANLRNQILLPFAYNQAQSKKPFLLAASTTVDKQFIDVWSQPSSKGKQCLADDCRGLLYRDRARLQRNGKGVSGKVRSQHSEKAAGTSCLGVSWEFTYLVYIY